MTAVQTREIGTIAVANDAFRRAGVGFVVTKGIQYLPAVCGLIAAVKEFDVFTEENDPHGEHDFGQLLWHDRTVFWGINYYDQELKCWADPNSPNCRRLLTIMLAEEY